MRTRLLVIIGMGVFIVMTGCRRRTEYEVPEVAEPIVTEERRESDDRMFEEQRRLKSEMAALEKQQVVLKQRIEDQTKAIAESEHRIQNLNGDLEKQKAQVSAYIDQHEVQVACAYASEVAASTDGEYSEQTKRCASTLSGYCAIGMLLPSFRGKVAAARLYVDKGEAEAQSLKNEISSEEKKLEAQRAELQATQESIDRIASEIGTLRQQLLAIPDGLQNYLPRAEGDV